MKKEFEFNLELYSEDKIKEAIEAFSDMGDISFSKGKIIIFGEDRDEIEEIFNELMNYVIGLINE